MVEPANPEFQRWQERYEKGDTPWDTGRPSTMLMQIVAEEKIAPCRAIDLGCGTGTNAVWLAQQRFDVVGVDLSPLASEQGTKRAAQEGVRVHFMAADVLKLDDLRPDFRFFFDRGLYHIVRKIDAQRYVQTVADWTFPAALGLVLAGNAKEKMEPGPPVVTEKEFRDEWANLFDFVWLREFRFDETPVMKTRPLGWAGFLRRKGR
jgi:SAM-dependent methyltransferase